MIRQDECKRARNKPCNTITHNRYGSPNSALLLMQNIGTVCVNHNVLGRRGKSYHQGKPR